MTDTKKSKSRMPTAKLATIILSIIAVGLLVYGALTPPPGKIDNSIIIAVGEIFMFAALWVFAHIVVEEKKDARTKLQMGDKSVSIEVEDDK